MQITTTQSGEWNCKMGYKERQRRIEVIGEVNLFGLEAIMETSGERDIAAGACSGGQVLNRQEGVGGYFRQREQHVLGQRSPANYAVFPRHVRFSASLEHR